MEPKMLLWALAYAKLGFKIFPCNPKSKAPLSGLLDFKEKASSDEGQIKNWWTKTPDANIATIPSRGGFLALDIDAKRGIPRPHWAPPTWEVISGGAEVSGLKGCHLYFKDPGILRYPPNKELPFEIKHYAPLTLPPSIHAVTGSEYSWKEGFTPFECKLAELPDTVVNDFKNRALMSEFLKEDKRRKWEEKESAWKLAHPGEKTFAECKKEYNDSHSQKFPLVRTTCPACGHNGCFGAINGRDSRTWGCWSAGHTDKCGYFNERAGDGYQGTQVDLDAFAAGLTVRDFLVKEGIMKARGRLNSEEDEDGILWLNQV